MIAVASRSQRAVSASAAIILHMLLLAILLLARAPSLPARPAAGAGLLVFDLPGAALSASRTTDQAMAMQAERQLAPPPLSRPTEQIAKEAKTNPMPGVTESDASAGGAGGTAGGADPFAMASLATLAPDRTKVGTLPDAALVAVATFAREHPGLSGPARIVLRLDAQGRVTDAKYAAGAIGNIRGALLAGYFRNCPLGLSAGEHPIDIDLASVPATALPYSLSIDEQGCHI